MMKGIRRLMICRNRYLLLLALLFTAAPAAMAQRYPFYNLSVDDGLIQSQAICLAQDKVGNLWIGTLGGLSRYDGLNFTNYTVRNGLHNNQVRAIAADDAGNIWIGSPDGLSQYDGKTFKHYPQQAQVRTRVKNAQQLQVAGDTVWWRMQGDIYFITKGKQKYFVTPGAQGEATAMLAEHDGIWIANGGMLYHQHSERWDTLSFGLAAGQPLPNISRIFRAASGEVLVASSIGLYRIEQGRFVPHWINGTGLSFANDIHSIAQDRSGALWLGTGSGAVKADTAILQTYNKRNGLSDNSFYDMLTDREGNVWMASDGQGVFRFSGTQFTGLDETMGLPSAQVMAITSNRRDSLFLGTYDAGLYIFKDGEVSPLSFPSNPVPAITTLCYTRGKLWIGTRGRGLWSYDRKIFRQYEAPARGFPSNNINCLYMDPTRKMWIGFADGIVTLKNDTFKTVATNTRSVSSFLNIGADSTLISMEGGLKLYHDGTMSDFVTNTVADTYAIQCFTIKGRELWMGSSDNGVVRYDLDTHKATVINKNSGLRSDFIYNIVADDEGNIWVGTGFGIHKITMSATGEPAISFYGKAQGITGMESNINAVMKLPDGTIWFGTTNGALHYQPHTTVVSAAPSSIIMQSVKIAGENTIERSWYDSSDNWYGVPYGLQLPYKKNSISFTFHAITLSGAQQVLYRYHIDGLDAPWSDWAPTNSVTYSALPPGRYVFRVQCRSGGDGLHNPELKYEFEIITPFQKTSWFRMLVLITCLLTGILLQYIISSRKQRRLRLLAKLRAEEQNKIRMRTAEDFHDEIGNKLTRINVLTSVLKNKVALTTDTERILGQIEDNTRQLYSGTRDVLWSLKPSNDNLYEILHRIRDFGIELFQDTEVNFTFTGTDEKWRSYRLPMDMSRNLIMIFKEALNNTLKYAHAGNVALEVVVRHKNVLQLVLKDDGRGFDLTSVSRGNGLTNMNTRAGRLHGKLYIDSRREKGTIINLTFKIPPAAGKGRKYPVSGDV